MRKILIVLVLSFFTFHLSAQLDKGTLYFGSSQVNYDFNGVDFNRGIFFKSEFGYFIKHNNLVGAGIGLNNSKKRTEVILSKSFSFSLFYKRYFFESRIKPFASFTFGADIGRINYSELALGGAFFINDFASLELSFGLPVHLHPYFPRFSLLPRTEFIHPSLSLAMKWYLFQDRDKDQSPQAIRTIEKGSWNVEGDVNGLLEIGKYNILRKGKEHSFNVSGEYFFANKSFVSVGADVVIASFSSTQRPETNKQSELRLDLGRYFFLSDILALRASATTSLATRKSGVVYDNSNDIALPQATIRQFKNSGSLGISMFKGRHKLDLGVIVESSIFSIKEHDVPKEESLNILPYADYEFFISPNFSFKGHYIASSNLIEYTDYALALRPVEIKKIWTLGVNNLDIGFRWYFLK